MERGEIQVNREYQRSNKIWPVAAQSYLIESILLGFPIPKLTLRQVTDIKTRASFREIVDGQQRSQAIADFYNGRLRLSDRVDTEELKGQKLSELDESYQTAFLNYRLAVDVFVGASDHDVRETFRRMNSYMVPLNPEEQRHAEFQGPFKWFIHRLAKRYDRHFTMSGLFKEKSLLRMQDMKLLTEVAHAFYHGIQTTNKSLLQALYKRFEQKFVGEGELEARIATALDRLFSWESLTNGELMKPFMAYSLILAIMHADRPIDTLSPAVNGLHGNISENAEANLTALAEDFTNRDEEVDITYKRFVDASTKSTNTRANRATRFGYFFRAITDQLDETES